jgi:hypothetical protein
MQGMKFEFWLMENTVLSTDSNTKKSHHFAVLINGEYGTHGNTPGSYPWLKVESAFDAYLMPRGFWAIRLFEQVWGQAADLWRCKRWSGADEGIRALERRWNANNGGRTVPILLPATRWIKAHMSPSRIRPKPRIGTCGIPEQDRSAWGMSRKKYREKGHEYGRTGWYVVHSVTCDYDRGNGFETGCVYFVVAWDFD